MSGVLSVVDLEVTTLWFELRGSKHDFLLHCKLLDSNFESLLWLNGWELGAELWGLAII